MFNLDEISKPNNKATNWQFLYYSGTCVSGHLSYMVASVRRSVGGVPNELYSFVCNISL